MNLTRWKSSFQKGVYEIGFSSVNITLATRTTRSIFKAFYLYSQAQTPFIHLCLCRQSWWIVSTFHIVTVQTECIKFKFRSILYERNFNTHIFWHAIWCRLLKSQCNLSRALSLFLWLRFKCHKNFTRSIQMKHAYQYCTEHHQRKKSIRIVLYLCSFEIKSPFLLPTKKKLCIIGWLHSINVTCIHIE